MAWRGAEFLKQLKEKKKRRLEAACIHLKNAVKQNISEPSNDGQTPAGPGEMPHKDTGRLRASIAHEVDEEVGRVGTNVIYGKFLETGTRFMPPHPYLVPTLAQEQSAIKNILKGH